MIISSQRYRNEEIIEEKRMNQDYVVSVSPVFIFHEEAYQVILDGHHALEAALLDNVNPEYSILSVCECDAIQLLVDNKIEEFLEFIFIDSSYYDISSGTEIW